MSFCQKSCAKARKRKCGKQRWYCKGCNKLQQETYQYKAYEAGINDQIKAMVRESCGIRSIGRLLGISADTVSKKIVRVAGEIEKPAIM